MWIKSIFILFCILFGLSYGEYKTETAYPTDNQNAHAWMMKNKCEENNKDINICLFVEYALNYRQWESKEMRAYRELEKDSEEQNIELKAIDRNKKILSKEMCDIYNKLSDKDKMQVTNMKYVGDNGFSWLIKESEIVLELCKDSK